jgi:diguanylate cyclase (GGDEF)-like protein/PAS domain S-box-containing protein
VTVLCDAIMTLSDHHGAGRTAVRPAATPEVIELVDDAVIATDASDVVTGWNSAAQRIYGIAADYAVGRSLHDLLTTTYHGDEERASWQQLLRAGSWRGRVRQAARSGRTVDVDSRVTMLRDTDGHVAGLVIVNHDLTAVAAAQAHAELQTRFAQELMDALDSRGAVLDVGGRVIAANARWRLGLTDRQRCACGPVAEGENWVESLRRSGVPEAGVLAGEVEALLRGDRAAARAECRCAAAGPGQVTAIEVVRVDAGCGGAIVVESDVSWRRRMQDELTYRASHDELTGLPNRSSLMEALAGSLRRLDGAGRRLAVLFCDLDGFKDINDGLGHAVGDQVLVAVARRLRQRCRSADVVARFGGDEFVVVLSITDVGQAVAMADRIVEVLAEPIVVGEVEVAAGVSVGVTVVDAPPEGDDPVGTLLRDADTAMYHAKGRGRGRYEFFDASLRENTVHRLELAAALHRAVTDNELEIRYQTRRHCGDRQVAGVEALLQWHHPAFGSIDPDTFIPIAERTGRIVEVGSWALRAALREFAALPDRRLTLAVNVSPRQLTSPRLVHSVAAALAESGLEPWRLMLEITESAFFDDPVTIRTVLTDLRGLGVTLALDDFGTGWSSLSYLRTLPVDVLKIDRSFVQDLPNDLDACAVVSAVLGLGHGMGLVVVAEGVEHEDQLTVLREMGCDEYQGFIDGRPGALTDILDPPRTPLPLRTGMRSLP